MNIGIIGLGNIGGPLLSAVVLQEPGGPLYGISLPLEEVKKIRIRAQR